jgi:hypothetical protein
MIIKAPQLKNLLTPPASQASPLFKKEREQPFRYYAYVKMLNF